MRRFLNSGRRIQTLVLVMGLASMPVLADDDKGKSESKTTSSSTAQVQIRVQGDANEKTDTENSDKQVTVVVNVTGDQAEGVKKAIEKLEGQLKNSGIPEALQQKALDAMRGQLKKSVDSHSQSGRIAVQLPFDPSQSGFPNAMVNAFSTSHALGPAQKEKLRNEIREALEEAGVDSSVVEKALRNVDKRLQQFNSQSSFSWNASGKLPYRVGIGCKPKDESDTQPGLEVETVFEDTPAAKAGLKQGDRLVNIDSTPIHSHDDIVAAVQKAGEENRAVQIEAKRGEDSLKFELKPQQTAVAELHSEFFQPSGKSGFPFRGQAWVMPPMPQDSFGPWNDPKIQEKIRDAVKDALETARRATEDAGATRETRKESVSAEMQNERNIDKLQEELKDVHKELQEMQEALKKLSEKQ